MFLAPLAHRFGWDAADTPRMGAGTLVGHLMECGMQVTGGYFADPGVKDVADLARLRLSDRRSAGRRQRRHHQACRHRRLRQHGDGEGAIALRGARSGALSDARCHRRFQPSATSRPPAPTGSQVSNAAGSARPDKLKVTVGFDGGFQGEAGVSYAGPGAQERGRLAAEIVRERLARVHGISRRSAHRPDRRQFAVCHRRACAPPTRRTCGCT